LEAAVDALVLRVVVVDDPHTDRVNEPIHRGEGVLNASEERPYLSGMSRNKGLGPHQDTAIIAGTMPRLDAV